MIFVLSLTCGIRSQIFCMDAKIRAFFAAAMGCGAVTGRNSATGSPRLSITMTAPSDASLTNFDVLMCNSRTDVVLICYIVALASGGRMDTSAANDIRIHSSRTRRKLTPLPGKHHAERD